MRGCCMKKNSYEKKCDCDDDERDIGCEKKCDDDD